MDKIELTASRTGGASFVKHIKADTGFDVKSCYQCGKCSAGCPVAFAMDYAPRQIIRLLQLGLTDQALKSNTIWLCASCETCSTRCPQGLEPAKLMEALRIVAKKKGLVAERNIDVFNDLILKSIEDYGRLHEIGIVLGFNLKTMQPFKDATAGIGYFTKGKISLSPHRINDNGAVKKIFAKVRQMGGEAK